jgi:arabinose-5-phosphate isomerase
MNPVFAQEIEALQQVGTRLDASLQAAVELILSKSGKVVVTGIGKSGIVGHKIAATLASTGTPAVFLNAGEALHGDLGMVGAEDVVLMLSKSADSAELAQLLPSVRRIGAALIGMFGAEGTPLASACDVRLDVSVQDEACPLSLAPTTSTTVMMVTGDALAVALMERRGFSSEDFAVFHPGGNLGRRLLYRVADVMRRGADAGQVVSGVPLHAAVEEMSRSSLGAVCVLDADRRIQGILTEGDVRRFFLTGVEATCTVDEVMTRDPKVVTEDARVGEALDCMESGERKVYVLPVIDAEKRYCGMLRMHDIVR